MQVLGSLVLIALGAGVLAVAWHGHERGELPAGSSGFKPYRANRDTNPLAFGFFLALYYVSGLALVIWGLLAMFGAAPPVRLV